MQENERHVPSVEKPWMQFFSEEAKRAQLPKESIYQHLRSVNADHRDDVAIHYINSYMTYGTLLDSIEQAAAAFASLGVKKNDIVTCCASTTPELVIMIYALNKLGACAMVIDPRYTAPVILDFIENAKSRLLVTFTVTAPVQELVEKAEVEHIVTFTPGESIRGLMGVYARMRMRAKLPKDERVCNWKAFMALGEGKSVPTVDYSEFQLAGIALTGGTTGAPKGVMFSNDGFNAVAMDFRYCGVEYDRTHRFMNIIPAFASYGMVASMHMPLSLGLEMVIIPKCDAAQVGKYIMKWRPQHTLMVPAHYEKLMNSKEMRGGQRLDFFITAGSGGDTMNAGLEAKLNGFLKERGAKFPLSQGYGMSEVSSAAACSCNGNFRSLSVGYTLLMNTIGIFKPDSTEELGYGEEGEICITGPAVMLGYLNNPEESEKVMIRHPDGQVWIHSGDLGSMDRDGFLYIKGRIKRMIIKFDGHKVFPVYIEGVIGSHPDVMSCAVVGVKDREHAQGQAVHAVVQLKSRSEAEVRPELEAMMKKEIEARGIPSSIDFVNDMPHTGMGKIDYRKLAKDFDARLNAAE